MSWRSERRVAVWLGALATLVYLPFNHCHFEGTDEVAVLSTARALYTEGDLAIDPGKNIEQGWDGRFYSFYAVGQSVLVLPLVAIGEIVFCSRMSP